jgi:hypothetical protein
MATLFSKAKDNAPKSDSNSTVKTIVPVNLGSKLHDLQEKRNQVASLEAEIELIEGEVKPVAREEFLKLMTRQGRRPESFILQSAGSNMLVIIMDKYLKLTETKEKALIDNKLADCIDEKTTFAFDAVLLEKYEKQISKAIESIKTIPDEDKERLIVPIIQKSIRKGTIDLLPKFKDPSLAFTLIEPICQLKNQS